MSEIFSSILIISSFWWSKFCGCLQNSEKGTRFALNTSTTSSGRQVAILLAQRLRSMSDSPSLQDPADITSWGYVVGFGTGVELDFGGSKGFMGFQSVELDGRMLLSRSSSSTTSFFISSSSRSGMPFVTTYFFASGLK